MARVLDGIKVVSFGLVISAPSTARMLTDLGADIIKVEPTEGDVMRKIRPIVKDDRGEIQSGIFTALNCGEKSIAVDLKNPDACAAVKKLIVEWADVVIANFKPGTLAKFGLDYETISRENPGIIYGEISGYGQKGPWKDRGAYDICVQSECGITAQNGSWGGKPHRVGFSVLDYGTGRDLAIGILGALFYRERTGRGQHVDCSLYNTGVTLLEDTIPGWDLEKALGKPVGSRHASASPHNLYKTKDGYINIIAINDMLWGRLCDMMGKPELKEDPVIGRALDRLDHMDEVDEVVESWTKEHTTDEVADLMDKFKLPRGKLQNIREIIECEQTVYWNMTPKVQQPHVPDGIRVNNCPIKYSDSETDIRGTAPLLGEHNREVICDILGYPDEFLKKLESEGGAKGDQV